ncbi:MAG: hypothetical protein ACR2MS_06855 [Weeksellaceae bacterium]
MIKYITYIIFILVLSGFNQNKGSSIKIENQKISFKDSLSFSIANNSNSKLIYLTDLSRYNYYSIDTVYPNSNIGLTIKITDSDSNIIDFDRKLINFDLNYLFENPRIKRYVDEVEKESKFYSKKYKELFFDHDSTWVYHNAFIREHSMLLRSKEKGFKKIALIDNLSPESYFLLGSYGFPLKPNKPYYLSLLLKIDSSRVKKYLPKKYIDSLAQNNIQIFHGEIESNKVPLIH